MQIVSQEFDLFRNIKIEEIDLTVPGSFIEFADLITVLV